MDRDKPDALSPQNVAAFLGAIGIGLRFNDWTGTVECRRDSGDWRALDDATLNELRMEMMQRKCRVPKEFFADAVASIAYRNRCDTMLDWLANLPKWDGVQRIDTMWIRHGGAPDTPLTRAMSRAWMIGAVRRLRDPGCKMDCVLVLEGKQGVGKSKALAALAPDASKASDCLTVGDDPKVVIEQTRGVWIVELAELAGLDKRSIERVKAFITRTIDTARMAYARYATSVPRRFILAASCNPDATGQYLVDPTGGRRFWPIPVPKDIDPEALRAECDQLWAEALMAENCSERHWLTAEMEAEATSAQAARTVEDPWEHLLANNFRDRTEIALFEIWASLGIETSRNNPKIGQRIARAMNRIGFKQISTTRDGKPIRLYRPRSTTGDDE